MPTLGFSYIENLIFDAITVGTSTGLLLTAPMVEEIADASPSARLLANNGVLKLSTESNANVIEYKKNVRMLGEDKFNIKIPLNL
jgi:hypothetical protein